MHYLSQALIPYATALKAKLTDGYAWHNAIWKAFPGRPDDTRDFLFRVDRQSHGFRVLLLSEHKPAPPEGFAWQTKEVSPGFLAHAAYRFQLKANPTTRHPGHEAKRPRFAIYDEAKLRVWLARKAESAGFAVETDTLEVGAPIDEAFVKDGRRGKHVAVDFSGLLRVTDRDRFIRSFNTGIGSAKGFGYGLLMLQSLH
jgi:CRISPR system Cascade subunit CasE